MVIDLVGVPLKYRSFNGSNKALPVLAHSLYLNGFYNAVQLDLERPNLCERDLLKAVSNADLICFAGCMTPQWPEIDELSVKVSEHLKNIGREDVPLIVGGYAAKNAHDVLRHSPWIAALFDGEGEIGIVQIARSVLQGTFKQARSLIKGICFIDDQGAYHHSIADRVSDLNPYDQNFNLIHLPEKHDMEIFHDQEGRQITTAQIYNQRGCPFVCEFCNKSMESATVVWLGDQALRDQLQSARRMGAKAIYLDVDTLTINHNKWRRHAEIIKEEGFIWGSNTRIDKISEEDMKHAVQNGCVYLFFGVEHILPGVTVAVKKFNGSLQDQIKQAKEYPKKVVDVFQSMRKVGLPSSYFIILGLPKAIFNENETEVVRYEPTTFEDDLQAIHYGLDQCAPDYLNTNVWRCMPGSTAAGEEMPKGADPFACVRPSGTDSITAGYFLPRVGAACGYKIESNHGVYRLCESVGSHQPTSTAVDAERIYDTLYRTMEHINARIDAGRKPATLFIDGGLVKQGLVWRDEKGKYGIAPLKEFENVQ